MGIGIVSPRAFIAEHAGRFADAAIVDARRQKAFREGHVPGAVWMPWEAWCESAPLHAGPVLAQEGYWGVLAPIDGESCERQLAALGVWNDRPIVVYADGPRTRGREGRIAWMLSYVGASDLYLLDRGWSGWVEAGGAVQTDTVTPVAGEFAVHLQSERRRTLEELRVAYRDGTLPMFIDTRSPAEYAGEIQEYLPRRGNLPGAQLLSFADLFDAEGRYVGRDRYLTVLPREAQDSRELIAYCEVGVRASLFAILHEVHTGQVVPVYDGSLMQWALERDLPLQTL